MYIPTSESWTLTQGDRCYFHPRAHEAIELSGAHIAAPPFVPDLSSESDDSDAQVVTPPDPSPMIPPISAHFTPNTQHHTQHSQIPHAHLQEAIDNALSFLPHAAEPVEKKQRKRRSLSSLGASHRIKGIEAFTEPALDGCLGGF